MEIVSNHSRISVKRLTFTGMCINDKSGTWFIKGDPNSSFILFVLLEIEFLSDSVSLQSGIVKKLREGTRSLSILAATKAIHYQIIAIFR